MELMMFAKEIISFVFYEITLFAIILAGDRKLWRRLCSVGGMIIMIGTTSRFDTGTVIRLVSVLVLWAILEALYFIMKKNKGIDLPWVEIYGCDDDAGDIETNEEIEEKLKAELTRLQLESEALEKCLEELTNAPKEKSDE